MKILLDTNVVLDVLLDREPFKADSYGAMSKTLQEGHLLFISASAIEKLITGITSAETSEYLS